MADVPAPSATDYMALGNNVTANAGNPLKTLQGWQNLTNSQVQQGEGIQNITNMQTSNQQAQATLQQGLNSQLAKATFAQAMYGEQTPEAYRAEIDRQVQQNPALTTVGNIWKGQIADGMTPEQLKTMAFQHGSALLDPTVQASAGPNGQIQFVNNGQSQLPITVPGGIARTANPGLGVSGPGMANGQVPVYPTRTDLAQPVPTIDNDPLSPTYGQPQPKPLGAVLQGQGAGGLSGPAGSQAVPPPSPSNPPRLNPTPIASGLPPGSAAPLEASATQYANDRAQAGNFNSRIQPLMQANTLLPTVGTGPGSEAINGVRSWLSSRAQSLGLTPGQVASANFDELNKYLVQAASNSGLRGNTDASLSQALAGNPSVHIQNLAAQNVVKVLIGQERMKQAALLNYHGTPQGYSDYLAKFSTAADPRAFVADLMTNSDGTPTPELTKMISGMTAPERTNFAKSYKLAQGLGLTNSTALPANQ